MEMKHKLLISVRILLTVVLVIAAAGSQLYGMDSKGRYFAFGIGQRTCEDYIKFREKRLETIEQHERYTKDDIYEIVDKILEHWIAGFLTAHDFYVTDTYNIAGNLTMDDLKARLEISCRANGKQYFAEAMVTLVQELHPQRVKGDAAK
jgi:hypothetical protein